MIASKVYNIQIMYIQYIAERCSYNKFNISHEYITFNQYVAQGFCVKTTYSIILYKTCIG